MHQQSPHAGQVVQSITGSPIGVVTGVDDHGITIALNSAEEAQLGHESVFSSTDSLLTLVCDRAHLDRYLVRPSA